MPAFASQGPPEIFDGSVTHFNENTDIFSFGSTMYKVFPFLDLMSIIRDPSSHTLGSSSEDFGHWPSV